MASLYERISKGTISVDEITASMKRSTSAGGKYFQSMEKQSQTVNGQLSTLKDNASQLVGTLSEGFSTTLAGEILPMLNEMATSLQEAFQIGGIEAFSSKFGEVFSNLIVKLAEGLPQLLGIGSSILQNLLLGIQTNLPTISQSAIQVIQTFVNFILQNLPMVLNMGIQIILQLILGIAKTLPELIPQIVDCVLLIVETLIDNIDLLIDAGIQLIIGLAEGLINAIPKLIDKIPIIIEKLLQAIINNLPKILSIGIQLLIELGAGLVSAIPQLIAMIPQVVSAIINAFKNTDWGSVGRQLLEGLLNGFSNAGNIIWNAIKKVGNSMIDGIKSFFGIHSPSRVMADIGKYLPQGFAVGIEADTDTAVKAIDEMNNEIEKKMKNAVYTEMGKVNTNATVKANNSLMNETTINSKIEGTVEIEGKTAGRLLAPYVTQTYRKAGAY